MINYTIIKYRMKKFVEAMLEILAVIILLIVYSIYFPQHIANIINTFTGDKITISNINVVFIKNNKIILSSKKININNNVILKNIDFNINFNSLNIFIDSAKLTIKKNIVAPPLTVFFNTIKIKQLTLNYKNAIFNTSLTINNDIVTMHGVIDNINIADNLKNLNLIPRQYTKDYLSYSLLSGNLYNIYWSFNWDKKDIEINAKIKNGFIRFTKNWPIAKHISADLYFSKNNTIIDIDNGVIDGITIKQGRVVLDWKVNHDAIISLKVNHQSEQVMNFLLNSPVGFIDKTLLKDIKLNGTVTANINILIPFDTTKDVKLDIRGNLFANQIILFDESIVDNLNASLSYNNSLIIIGQGNIAGERKEIELFVNNDQDIILNTRAKNETIYMHKKKDKYLIAINKKNIKGKITFDNGNNLLPIVVFKDFNIKDFNIKDNKITTKLKATDFSSFYAVFSNIKINDFLLPDFEVEFIRENNSLKINDFTVIDDYTNNDMFTVGGSWGDKKTHLYLNIKGDNLSKLFNTLNIKKQVPAAKFNINTVINCDCDPWLLSLKNLKNNTKIHLGSGAFTNQNIGIGKLLLLININALADRLKLNSKDIDIDNFNYDSIDFEAKITKGTLYLQKFKLLSKLTNIELRGSTNIINETYDLNTTITPSIKDGVPIISYLLGGGLSGLGAWLVDKTIFNGTLLAGLLEPISNIDYKITGTWREPIIK